MKNGDIDNLNLDMLTDVGMNEGIDGSLDAQNKRLARRYRNSMGISGIGVILFGVWNIVKSILYFMFDNPVKDMLMGYFEGGEIGTIVFIFTISIILFDMILRLIVGLSAYAEARGKKKGKGYIVVGSLMLVFQLIILILSLGLFDSKQGAETIIDEAVTFIVDATAAYALFDTVYSSIKLKMIRKNAGGGK